MLVSLVAAIKAADYHWPKELYEHGVWPYVVVVGAGFIVSGVVAAAAHAQMSGPWPALLLGVCAPTMMSKFLSGIEVTEGKPKDPENGDAKG